MRRGEPCPVAEVRRGQVSSVPSSPVRSRTRGAAARCSGHTERASRAVPAASRGCHGHAAGFASRPVWFPGCSRSCSLRHGPHCHLRPRAAPVGRAVPGTGPLLPYVQTRKDRVLCQACLQVWWELLQAVDSWVIAQPAGTGSKACLVKKAR